MDASTAAAVAALVVATAAFIIALAQVLQQYFVTGQSIRMCDSVVFGDMPGRGHRVWQMSQFRFRVVYSIPQISLAGQLWPGNWPMTFKKGRHRLPNLSGIVDESENSGRDYLESPEKLAQQMVPYGAERLEGGRRRSPKSLEAMRRRKRDSTVSSKSQTGEASWASFCRIMHYSCRECARFDFVDNDIDRCPSDLPSVPMQLSARDVIVICLTVGMKCTEASFTTRTLSMQGAAGIITSSQHPILGPLLHFTPGHMDAFHGIVDTGFISMPWLGRTWGVWPVAGAPFARRARRSVEKYAGIWTQRIKTSKVPEHGLTTIPHTSSKRANSIGRKRVKMASSHTKPTQQVVDDRPLSLRSGFHDGLWSLVPRIIVSNLPTPPPPPASILNAKERVSRESRPIQPEIPPVVIRPQFTSTEKRQSRRKSVPFQATVEDDDQDESGSKGRIGKQDGDTFPILTNRLQKGISMTTHPIEISGVDPELQKIQVEAQRRQVERNTRAEEIAQDEETVERLETQGRIPDRISGTMLLQWTEEGSSKSKGKQQTKEPPTSKEQEAFDREAERRKQRHQRNRDRQARSDKQSQAIARFGEVNWFWLSQTDIVPGFWATLWRPFPLLDAQICTGAVMCILSALQGFSNETNVRYFELWDQPRYTRPTIDWMLQGMCTFPGYAHNGRGGVVCSGQYAGVKFDVFKDYVPAIELLHSYEYQVKRFRPSDQKACVEELVELMRLDAWLSLCGRTDEIANGRNELIKQTPAMVQLLMAEFSYDFLNMEMSDLEGGMQDNKALADNMMDFLLDEELSGAEQLYILVATLRTVKVGQCILDGQDTAMLEQMMREDMQVQLV
ncbi:hypothetical protein VE00_11177 [Pseudogymnoascus sp. WSF 3629]|nr:hypothetical protein VE00_11177 [Pseudogymnoascus sp. WSF 3629]